ncbi:hypothetical protein QCA50_007776 [Cerrena zonata]|uniref:Cupredoxin n=1 Tax=Cerrena zonata TaxID=2478898 RepID=A0AAW0G6K4_9APHY
MHKLFATLLLTVGTLNQVLCADHPVVIGGPGVLKFTPPFVNAAVGDTITFSFKQKNHTVTQSTFENPCLPMQAGFDSGFVPVADDNVDGPFQQAQFAVTDTNPVWAYCRQADHCQQGMVFAINPGDKFDAFQAAAMGNTAASTSSSSSSTATPTSSPPPPTSSSTPPASSSTQASSSSSSPIASTVTATVTASGTQQVTTYASFPGSAAPTALASNDHKVMVGGPNRLIFDPATVTAQVGDTITFVFQQKNHTVTQSSFANPCQSLTETSTNGQIGFDSGFMPVANGSTSFPTFTIKINDTTPIWAFCKQTLPFSHCAQGMVFAANSIESGPNNFNAFKTKATDSASGASNMIPANDAAKAQLHRNAGIAIALVALFMGLL